MLLLLNSHAASKMATKKSTCAKKSENSIGRNKPHTIAAASRVSRSIVVLGHVSRKKARTST